MKLYEIGDQLFEILKRAAKTNLRGLITTSFRALCQIL